MPFKKLLRNAFKIRAQRRKHLSYCAVLITIKVFEPQLGPSLFNSRYVVQLQVDVFLCRGIIYSRMYVFYNVYCYKLHSFLSRHRTLWSSDKLHAFFVSSIPFEGDSISHTIFMCLCIVAKKKFLSHWQTGGSCKFSISCFHVKEFIFYPVYILC